MARKGGLKRKTRHIYQKHSKERGKISIRKYLHEYNPDDKVILKSEPAYQKGLYFRRFHGKEGRIVSKRGFCYLVEINDAGKKKQMFIHPVHLQEVKLGVKEKREIIVKKERTEKKVKEVKK